MARVNQLSALPLGATQRCKISGKAHKPMSFYFDLNVFRSVENTMNIFLLNCISRQSYDIFFKGLSLEIKR